MAKIIHLFPQPPPLTRLMVQALITACEKQKKHEPFGQVDTHGSFAGLLRREYIKADTIIFHGQRKLSWYVTRSGINKLRDLGYYY